jgi:ubiquinone/menaquinone biosynthesis C-methylase UbiE
MDEKKQAWGKEHYPLVTFVNSRIDADIPLDTDSVDWAFCSHTLEHVVDLDKAWSEICRISSKAIYVIVPLESDELVKVNPSHVRHSDDWRQWGQWLISDKFPTFVWSKPYWALHEAHLFFCRPDEFENVCDAYSSVRGDVRGVNA